jgi:hypothetical protein
MTVPGTNNRLGTGLVIQIQCYGTGTANFYPSGTGFGPGSNLKCNAKVKKIRGRKWSPKTFPKEEPEPK